LKTDYEVQNQRIVQYKVQLSIYAANDWCLAGGDYPIVWNISGIKRGNVRIPARQGRRAVIVNVINSVEATTNLRCSAGEHEQSRRCWWHRSR